MPKTQTVIQETEKLTYTMLGADLQLIYSVLDVALKAGGLQNKPVVDKLLEIFTNPEREGVIGKLPVKLEEDSKVQNKLDKK